MINLHFSIDNPWAKKNYKSLFCRSGEITKYTSWEFEIIRYNYTIADFGINYTVRQDHAGFSLSLGLFGYIIYFMMLDSRHWDNTNNCWEIYKEDENVQQK